MLQFKHFGTDPPREVFYILELCWQLVNVTLPETHLNEVHFEMNNKRKKMKEGRENRGCKASYDNSIQLLISRM